MTPTNNVATQPRATILADGENGQNPPHDGGASEALAGKISILPIESHTRRIASY